MPEPMPLPPAGATVLHGLPAPAKVNLFLHVVGRRADGYHLLQSVFVPIDWCDTLHIERLDDGRLERIDLGPALPEDDLCLRAARALQKASGSPAGARITIDKQLPSGAGLGGGSSDAATTLIALNQLWGLHWPRARLVPLALALGADVPFFMGHGAAFVEGIGERLTPLAVPALRLAVVKPPQSLPTPEIFSHPALVRDTPPVIVAGFPDGAADAAAAPPPGAVPVPWPDVWGDVAAGQLFGRNDLEPPAKDRCPAVADAVNWLVQRHGNGRMSGSGSAAFAIVAQEWVQEDSGHAQAPAVATFPQGMLPAGWVGRMCRSLERLPLAGWLQD
jgi:4-diphosphocytidyl-2-C-methyl-D-erythritol kinase